MSDSQITAGIPRSFPVLPSDKTREEVIRDAGAAGRSLAPPTLLQRCFSFPAMLGSLLVAAVATRARAFVLDPDVWWHIKQGGDILTSHHVPRVDNYSLLLSGRPWTAYEWLGDILLAVTYRAGGVRGMELLLLVLGSAIMLALYTLGTLRSGNSKAGFVAATMLFVTAVVSFNLRPQMLGYLFLILTVIILERFRQGKRFAAWLLPALMLLWVNSHGSWVIGLGTIGVYLASGLVKFHWGDIEALCWSPADRLRLASVFVLSICATLITPYGTQLAKYPFEVASTLPISLANVVEWQSMPFNEALGKIFLVLLLGFVLLQVAFRFSWSLAEFGLFLFGAAMACLHVRFLLLLVPFFTPLLATMLARWVPTYERAKDRYLLNAALMAIVLAVIVWYFPSQAGLERTVADQFPVGAVEYLDHHSVPVPMFNNYSFGGYLIWARGPEHKVFMDGRSDLYERNGVLADFMDVNNMKPDAFAVLQKYGIQSCLLAHDEPLATVLAALPDWKKIYEDHTSILFVRQGGSAATANAGQSGGASEAPAAQHAAAPAARKEQS